LTVIAFAAKSGALDSCRATGLRQRLLQISAPIIRSGTSELRACRHRVGNSLSRTCVRALIDAGEVSQAEVDRHKRTRH
jgi:hypothetical protein